MAKKMPIGTIRHWESGDFIKAHEGSLFSGGWIPLSTSPELEEVGRSCDRMAIELLRQKLPINGEKFLDHEIKEFKGGLYSPDDFKQYSGFHGAGSYSFRNEFSKRYMNPKISLAEAINDALVNANEEKLNSLGREARDMVLTKDEIANIRASIRKDASSDNKFTIKEAQELEAIVLRTRDQLNQGLNFEGEQKIVYDKAVLAADSLATSYDRLGVKKQTKVDNIEAIKKAFPDNWGVQNGFETYIDIEYSKYLDKYKKRIIEDETADQEKTFGVKLDAPIEEFYPALYKKLEKDPSKYPFQEIVDIRFAAKYGKELKGNWTPEMLPAIESIEKMITTIPEGHFLTNKQITSVTQVDYDGGNHGGYAWYSSNESRINLSKDLLGSKTGIWSRLSNSNEFESTMAHEIGHAVSEKFGRDNTLAYKQFTVACGWSYSQSELKAGMKATGSDRAIPREGSNSHIKLLTDYAHVSQEEAFAEYYSIYSNNKKEIDKWLSTGDTKPLHKISRVTSDSKPSNRNIGQASHKIMTTAESDKIDTTLRHLGLDADDHISIEMISPWGASVHPQDTSYSTSKIRSRLGYKHEDMPPIVAIKDHNKYEIIDGANRQALAKMNKKLLPTISISKELHSHLSRKGYSNEDIARYTLTTKQNEKVPYQASEPKTISGLDYRNNILKVEDIKNSYFILKKMQEIYNGEELKKALETLGL